MKATRVAMTHGHAAMIHYGNPMLDHLLRDETMTRHDLANTLHADTNDEHDWPPRVAGSTPRGAGSPNRSA